MADTYKIVRHYYPDSRGDHRRPRTIKRGLTLEQAQEHCQRDDTRKEGQWFDGYDHDCCK